MLRPVYVHSQRRAFGAGRPNQASRQRHATAIELDVGGLQCGARKGPHGLRRTEFKVRGLTVAETGHKSIRGVGPTLAALPEVAL